MRVPVTLIFILPLLLSLCAPAEVIHLKNGRTIWADRVEEKGDHVEYEIGDDSYAIPKALVDRIEAGGSPPEGTKSAEAKVPLEIPEIAPPPVQLEPDFLNKIIHDNKVDTDTLAALEKNGDAQVTAAGYYFAGKFEFDHGNFAKSKTYFEMAIRFDGQSPAILSYYAALLVRTGNAKEALPYAEKSARIAPDSPDALDVLGYAQFAADRNDDAIKTWKRSLKIRPDATIQKLVKKAEHEAAVEANYSENESGHFTLRYEGRQTSISFRRELMATLDSAYDELSRDLGGAPRSSISVVLYTGQAFFDVTQAPSWTGAVNDGKLRIPVEGMNSVTPELARVLKHELAHSFINQLSNGRCPQWLHEGIAQALEPKSLSSHGHRLAQLFATQHAIPYNALEGSFIQYSGIEAVLAYDESLAAVDYINDTYGMSDIRRILERLGEGSSTESALRATIHSDYGQLETEVGKYLVNKYGN